MGKHPLSSARGGSRGREAILHTSEKKKNREGEKERGGGKQRKGGSISSTAVVSLRGGANVVRE